MRVEHWRRGARHASNGLLLWFALWSLVCTMFAGRPSAAVATATRQAAKDATGYGLVDPGVRFAPMGIVITILGRFPRATVSVSGGGGGSFPYGAAALPTGMTWNYTEGGTREVTGSPLSFSYAAVPTVTGTTYDVSDTASWATAVAAAVDGDGIRITADFSTTGLANLSRTSSSGGWVLVFTDRKATLDTNVPYSANYLTATSTNRIHDSDTTCYRTITMTGGSTTPLLGCAQSALGYWIVGIKFTRNNDANEGILAFDTGTVTQESHWPNRIVVDRCIVDAAEHAKRGINCNGKDLLFSGSQIINATSSPQGYTDSQAIASWRGGKNILIYNNACSGESEVIASGGSGHPPLTTQPFTNAAIIRNHLFKPAAWDSDVTYPLKKNMFEHKTAERALWLGNVCDNYKASSGGQFYQIMFTPENNVGTATFQGIFDVNVIGNYLINGDEGGPLTISAQGSQSNLHSGMARITFVHTYQQHGSADAQSKIQILGEAPPKATNVNDCHLEHNTFHCDEAWMVVQNDLSGIGDWERFVCRNNANARAPSFGPIFTSTTLNKAALDDHLGAGNWTFASNAQVSGGASWGASSSLLVAPYNCIQDTAVNLFTDSANSDYSAKAGGPLDGTATDGFDVGADVAWVLSLTTGVV